MKEFRIKEDDTDPGFVRGTIYVDFDGLLIQEFKARRVLGKYDESGNLNESFDKDARLYESLEFKPRYWIEPEEAKRNLDEFTKRYRPNDWYRTDNPRIIKDEKDLADHEKRLQQWKLEGRI